MSVDRILENYCANLNKIVQYMKGQQEDLKDLSDLRIPELMLKGVTSEININIDLLKNVERIKGSEILSDIRTRAGDEIFDNAYFSKSLMREGLKSNVFRRDPHELMDEVEELKALHQREAHPLEKFLDVVQSRMAPSQTYRRKNYLTERADGGIDDSIEALLIKRLSNLETKVPRELQGQFQQTKHTLGTIMIDYMTKIEQLDQLVISNKEQNDSLKIRLEEYMRDIRNRKRTETLQSERYMHLVDLMNRQKDLCMKEIRNLQQKLEKARSQVHEGVDMNDDYEIVRSLTEDFGAVSDNTYRGDQMFESYQSPQNEHKTTPMKGVEEIGPGEEPFVIGFDSYISPEIEELTASGELFSKKKPGQAGGRTKVPLAMPPTGGDQIDYSEERAIGETRPRQNISPTIPLMVDFVDERGNVIRRPRTIIPPTGAETIDFISENGDIMRAPRSQPPTEAKFVEYKDEVGRIVRAPVTEVPTTGAEIVSFTDSRGTRFVRAPQQMPPTGPEILEFSDERGNIVRAPRAQPPTGAETIEYRDEQGEIVRAPPNQVPTTGVEILGYIDKNGTVFKKVPTQIPPTGAETIEFSDESGNVVRVPLAQPPMGAETIEYRNERGDVITAPSTQVPPTGAEIIGYTDQKGTVFRKLPTKLPPGGPENLEFSDEKGNIVRVPRAQPPAGAALIEYVDEKGNTVRVPPTQVPPTGVEILGYTDEKGTVFKRVPTQIPPTETELVEYIDEKGSVVRAPIAKLPPTGAEIVAYIDGKGNVFKRAPIQLPPTGSEEIDSREEKSRFERQKPAPGQVRDSPSRFASNTATSHLMVPRGQVQGNNSTRPDINQGQSIFIDSRTRQPLTERQIMDRIKLLEQELIKWYKNAKRLEESHRRMETDYRQKSTDIARLRDRERKYIEAFNTLRNRNQALMPELPADEDNFENRYQVLLEEYEQLKRNDESSISKLQIQNGELRRDLEKVIKDLRGLEEQISLKNAELRRLYELGGQFDRSAPGGQRPVAGAQSRLPERSQHRTDELKNQVMDLKLKIGDLEDQLLKSKNKEKHLNNILGSLGEEKDRVIDFIYIKGKKTSGDELFEILDGYNQLVAKRDSQIKDLLQKIEELEDELDAHGSYDQRYSRGTYDQEIQGGQTLTGSNTLIQSQGQPETSSRNPTTTPRDQGRGPRTPVNQGQPLSPPRDNQGVTGLFQSGPNPDTLALQAARDQLTNLQQQTSKTIADLQNQLQELRLRENQWLSEREELTSRIESEHTQTDKLADQLELKASNISGMRAQIAAGEQRIIDQLEEINSLRKEIAGVRAINAQLVGTVPSAPLNVDGTMSPPEVRPFRAVSSENVEVPENFSIEELVVKVGKENEELKEKLRALDIQHKNLTQSVNLNLTTVKGLEARITELNNELVNKENQIKNLQQFNRNLNSQIVEVNNTPSPIRKFQHQEVQVSTINDDSGIISQLEEELRDRDNLIAELRFTIEDLSDQLRVRDRNLEEVRRTLEIVFAKKQSLINLILKMDEDIYIGGRPVRRLTEEQIDRILDQSLELTRQKAQERSAYTVPTRSSVNVVNIKPPKLTVEAAIGNERPPVFDPQAIARLNREVLKLGTENQSLKSAVDEYIRREEIIRGHLLGIIERHIDTFPEEREDYERFRAAINEFDNELEGFVTPMNLQSTIDLITFMIERLNHSSSQATPPVDTNQEAFNYQNPPVELRDDDLLLQVLRRNEEYQNELKNLLSSRVEAYRQTLASADPRTNAVSGGQLPSGPDYNLRKLTESLEGFIKP